MATAREKVGYALLLSAPPGVGVTGFVATRTAGGALTPLALAAGALTFAAIFLAVAAIAFTGPEDAAAGESGR